MNRCILLVADRGDDGCDAIQHELKRLNQNVFRLDTSLLSSGQITLTFYENGVGSLNTKERTISLSGISAAWFGLPRMAEQSQPTAALRNFAQQELRELLRQLYLLLPQAIWINHPDAAERARGKALQLRTALECGFFVPKTCITNLSDDARKFLGTVKTAIYKTLRNPYLSDDYDRLRQDEPLQVIPTSIIHAEHAEQLDVIANTGGIFQEYLDKSFEVRVTVVGNKVYAVKIDSQSLSFPKDRVDWRHSPDFISILSKFKLPQEIAQKCLTFLKKYELSFGAFDFIVSKDGRYVFLEMNPGGSWIWSEQKLHLGIAEEIARTLIEK